jgi:hypothetical protein
MDSALNRNQGWSLAMQLILAILLIATQSYADYIPGRMRLSAEGILPAEKGSGQYRGISRSRVLEYRTDEKGVSHYLVELKGSSRFYEVTKMTQQKCEDVYLAQYREENGAVSTLRLVDRSVSTCDLTNLSIWSAELRSNGERGPSALSLAGDPEHFQMSH